MEKEPPKNIFDAGRDKEFRHEKKKKKKKKKKLVSAPLTTQEGPISLGDPIIEGMFEKMRTMQQEIEEKYAKVCELTGMGMRQLENYLEDSTNFPSVEYAKIEQQKDELYRKIWKISGAKGKMPFGGYAHEKKKKSKSSRKLSGARRKWIPLR